MAPNKFSDMGVLFDIHAKDWTLTNSPPKCPWCGETPRDGETHGKPGLADPYSGDIPVQCSLIRIVHNPRRLGVITGITE